MTTSRPTVFLSSTIYDFSDLRSALKYWLEEAGYNVAASEFANFPANATRASAEACLSVIDRCQYFVLLIGARAGGHLVEDENATITMLEYRHAYERALTKQLTIVALVRRSIWELKADRAALASMLRLHYKEQHQLSEHDIENIQYHKSRLIADADLVFRFLAEVTKEDADAEPRLGDFVHAFETFKDVTDVLQGRFVRSRGLRQAALQANLEIELKRNVAQLLERSPENGTQPIYEAARAARGQVVAGPNERSQIVGSSLFALAQFAVRVGDGRNLASHAIDEAIISGEFLEYSVDKHRYEASAFHHYLLAVRQSIETIRRLADVFDAARRREVADAFHKYEASAKPVGVDNLQIWLHCHLYDTCKELLERATQLVEYLADPSKAFSPITQTAASSASRGFSSSISLTDAWLKTRQENR
jgi:hypothetical protein